MRAPTVLHAAAHATPDALFSSARRRVASLSVDLDPLRCYYQIHGLGTPPRELEDVVLRRGLPRFLEIFARYGIQATFFVVGSDLGRDPGRALLTGAARDGHELGNHSYSHPYDLARLKRAEITDEVTRCHAALRQVYQALPQGRLRVPHGFRAPGYDLSSTLLDVVQEAGYRYDSSLFPCPSYYAAKLAVMGRMHLQGRRSASVIGDPLALLCPAQPYRPDPRRPWLRGQASLVELPIAVTPGLRLPAIGTYLLLAERLRIYLLEAMRGHTFFNLELHGLDLLDAVEDGIPTELVLRQPDLRVPLSAKRVALLATLDRLQGEYDILPLHEVAEEVHRAGALHRDLTS